MKLFWLLRPKPRFYLYFVFFCVSCSSGKNLIGTYHSKGKDFSYALILNKDSTFTLSRHLLEVQSKCTGKWHFSTQTDLLLKCDAGGLMDALSMGDLSNKEFKVTILKRNKLEMENTTLIKVD